MFIAHIKGNQFLYAYFEWFHISMQVKFFMEPENCAIFLKVMALKSPLDDNW